MVNFALHFYLTCGIRETGGNRTILLGHPISPLACQI
jgi:hypothetical protein